jgi:hypothetical protein
MKIKKFLDYIKNYHLGKSVKLTSSEVVDTYEMIKDYCISINDMIGLDIMWDDYKVEDGVAYFHSDVSLNQYVDTRWRKIEYLKDFRVVCQILISREANYEELINEIESSISQLESEDFKVELGKTIFRERDDDGTMTSRIGHIRLTIKHRSYKD